MSALRRRLVFIGIILSIAAAVLCLRLIRVQIVQGADLRQQAQENRERLLLIPEAPRGLIHDRNGFPLVVNEPRYAVEANPPFIRNMDRTIERLVPLLGLPGEALAVPLESGSSWVSLEPYATMQVGEAIEQLGIDGVTARRRWVRRYPHNTLAAHLLGFVSRDGQGYYGLEGYYDRFLQSNMPEWVGETSPSGRWPLPQEEGTVAPPFSGTDLVLTIDIGVQSLVEIELARALAEYGARGGTIIVMDPRTGAILALASQPAFDPNRYERYIYADREEIFMSPAFGAQYEPGSVFKIITMAAALNSGTVTSRTTYVDAGQIELGGRVFTNWDQNAYGERDMIDLLGQSLNVGAVWLAIQMGPDTFYQYLRGFGFGQPAGLDLQGEASGRLRVPDDLDWHDSDLGTNSFGQGLAVTPVQMVSAVAAVANGGRLMRPYVVAQQILPDGTVIESQPVVRGQPISEETADELVEVLAQAIERRIPQVQVPGYRVAGKTGTAQIPIPGGYDPEETIASFVGFGPVRDPQLVVLVRLDRPQASPWGTQTAAPVFQRLASQLFPMLGIVPDDLVTEN
jgi:cell division protein FtsI/penicillin-binding protein 2